MIVLTTSNWVTLGVTNKGKAGTFVFCVIHSFCFPKQKKLAAFLEMNELSKLQSNNNNNTLSPVGPLCVQNKHIDDDEYGTCRMTWALFLLLLLFLFLLLALCNTTALYPVVAESEQTHNLIHPFGAAAEKASVVSSLWLYIILIDLITVHLTSLVSILD
jgi:hypothetical protein